MSTSVDPDPNLLIDLQRAIPCTSHLMPECTEDDPIPAEWIVALSGHCPKCGGDTGGIQTLFWCSPCKTAAEALGWALHHGNRGLACGPLHLTIHRLERINPGGDS